MGEFKDVSQAQPLKRRQGSLRRQLDSLGELAHGERVIIEALLPAQLLA